MALRLNWTDERYVRIYTRDTIEWSALSWDAQALYMQLNRKADRRGRVLLGRVGRRGVAALVGRADLWPRLEPALAELEQDGCIRVEGDVLGINEFEEAQESPASLKRRQEKFREGKRLEEGATASRPPAPGKRPPLAGQAEAPTGNPGGFAPGGVTSGNVSLPSNETLQNVTRGYGTEQRGEEGTARPPRSAPQEPAAEARRSVGEELSREFEHDLAREEAPLDPRLAELLRSMRSGEWADAADLGARLGITDVKKLARVSADLAALRSLCLVQCEERGSPPVTHWRRPSTQVLDRVLRRTVHHAEAAGGAP